MNPFRSVKFRLTLSYTIVLLIFLTLFALLMHAELSRTLYQDADLDLAEQTDSLENSLFRYFSFFKGIEDDEMPQAIQGWDKAEQYLSRSRLMIKLVNRNHEVISSNLTGWQNEVIFPDFERESTFMEKGASFQTIHFQNSPIRLYYRSIQYQGREIAIAQIATRLEGVETALHRLVLIILVWIPVAVLAACVAGWFLAKRSFKPVESMIDEANQITAAYLKGRLPRTGSGDELDHLAETLNQMMDRIEESTNTIREFSIDVSHELKTPLAIIRGEIDLALRRSRSADELRETLNTIMGEVLHLISLVDDLMLLVRSDAKQLTFERNDISLDELLSQTVHLFQERAQARQIKLSFLEKAKVSILGDALHLKRLFSNLIDNAIKFTPEEGMVRVELGSAKPGWARIEVIDNGIGIENAMKDRVFSRFTRTDQARPHDGSGLGLSISKAICEGHQGKISLLDREGGGTRVVVLLPIQP